ncbi:MAG TPA: discoidin domain-containing protein [Terriglobales bacterium]|nr:discoidin domain-containing protein [Terriglobales bacterium]
MNPLDHIRVSRRKFLSTASGFVLLAHTPKSLLNALAQHEPTFNAKSDREQVSTIEVDTSKIANSFDPDQSLGSSMDILPEGVVDKIYTQPVIEQCLSAGWGPITYRQNTELQIAAWHWNPNGTWSDPAHQRGYFTGSARPSDFIRHSQVYPLPHRGQTHDGAAGVRGYSRLTDGNPSTYWKSNPYLSARYTGEDDSLHPQWVIVDLGAIEKINVVRIAWAAPFARSYEIQYWSGEDAMTKATAGSWITFAGGTINNADGGTVTLTVAPAPLSVRFIRIWMTASSNTGGDHDKEDPRSSLGYAIHEISAGTFSSDSDFVDLVRHSPDSNQTVTYCSSTDPWHSSSDLDVHGGDQTGFDLFFTGGITNKLPALIPIAMLFGTPDDAAAQIAYLKARNYPISFVEMGEEPDGQYMLPEDYGALYLQFADALHRVDPKLKLGGPVFTGLNDDLKVWPDSQGRTSWLGRFLEYLKAHNRLFELAFMSFEHYPFPPCEITWSDLYREPDLTRKILQTWREDGLPANVPMMNTESNVTYALALPMTEIFSALWLADSVGAFLTEGGYAYYHSPIQPEPLRSGCHGWTTYGNFVADEQLKIRAYTAQYFAGRLINLEWVKHGAGVHRLVRGSCTLADGDGHLLVSVYPVQQPSGEWSLLLVNKDQFNAHRVRVSFVGSASDQPRSFSGPVTMVAFGSAQYQWQAQEANSIPKPNDPPVVSRSQGGSAASFLLPCASVVVLRGRID